MNHVLVQCRDGVASVVLNRPDTANAIDLPTAVALREAVSDVVRRRDVGAIAILGQGQHFCVGGDVRAMATEPPSWAAAVAANVHAAILDLHQSPHSVVTGVQGAVAGGGIGLALVADIVVATSDTRFVPAWNRIGLSPDGGATWFLPRTIGPQRAAQMLLTGREVRGDEALSWGLVAELTDASRVEHRTLELAAHAARGRRTATTLQLLRTSSGVDLATRLTEEEAAIRVARALNQEDLDRFLAETRSTE